VKAVQDEASPAALRRKAPEAQDLLLSEHEGVLRRHLPEAHDAGRAHPCDGRAKATTAIGELPLFSKDFKKIQVSFSRIPVALKLHVLFHRK
jgi:hypothetical protein